MAQYIGIKYFLTCNSGSSANLLAMSALCSDYLGDKKLKAGDEVITCNVGFPTTLNPIIMNGLIPVFVDAELPSYNINTSLLENAISKKTKAIMIAHTLGNPFDLKVIRDLCNKYNLYLIEDCCDALGSTYDQKHVGTYGDIGTLSFYPAHHITMGEGGAVFTSSSKIKMALESLRDWGRDCWCKTGCDNTCKKRFEWKLGDLPKGYDHKYIYSNLGYNLKITDMQASVGLAQYEKLDIFVTKRRRNFIYLSNLLLDLKKYFILPEAAKNSNPSWFGFPITIKDNKKINRANIINFLEENNIATRLVFAGNLTKQPYMKNISYRQVANTKISNKIMHDSFWIGIHPALEKNNLNYVSEKLHEYIVSIEV